MTNRSPRRASVTAAITALLVAGSSLLAPAAAQAEQPAPAQASQEVAGASLTWGVKQSFRNYVQGPIAHGEINLLGATTTADSGEFAWGGGVGEGAADGSSADVVFAETDGVHFQGHEMEGGFALDLSFTKPRIVIESATSASLYADVRGREYVDTTTVGPEFEALNTRLASLDLRAPTVSGDVMTWSAAPAALTEEGVAAFAGFYEPGEALDPVTFSMALPEIEAPPERTQTTTTLTASAASIAEDDDVDLTAVVEPAADGAVTFSRGGTALAAPVTVEEGTAGLTVSDLPTGAHSITAAFAPADPASVDPSQSEAVTVTVVGETKTEGARLEWGVRDSFRNYVTGPIAHGSITRLGTTTGEFVWSEGAGTVQSDGSAAEVSFGEGNGVHFRGHEMPAGSGTYALDLKFTNPRVEVTSASEGTLYLDVRSRIFEGMTDISDKFFEEDGVPVATLQLPAFTSDGTSLTWSGAAALLTEEGEEAFGGFYEPGEDLAPVTFTVPVDGVSERESTSVALQASAKNITEGQSVTFNATVDPDIPGTVSFTTGNERIGQAQQVENAKATLTTSSLDARVHHVRAEFTPADETRYSHSYSDSVEVAVAERRGGGGGNTGGGGSNQAAGSLRWGVSNYFAAYTRERSNTAACPTPSRHCAGGSILTSGVGAGWSFPQASGGSWNAETQTGTVRYSGTVNFNGYGITMFRVSNPTINVTGPNSATLTTGYSGSHGPSSVPLNLAGATKTVGAGGEVTWSNVPVQGGLRGISAGQDANFDSLTFTVGSASTVTFGATTEGDDAKPQRTAAPTAPATTGIEVLTDADKLTPGGRIELRAEGFEPDDEGVLVVLYSEQTDGPIVLDEEAGANESGTVNWAGRLPEDADLGEHIITMQGSIDAGAVIEIVEDAEAKAAKNAAAEQAGQGRDAGGAAVVSGLLNPGMALWEWWASAAGLVAIAACTTLLAVRQQRREP